MANGVVARLLTDKGFGFIKDNQTGAELFFHRSAVKGTTFEQLREGSAVQFEEGQGAKGPRAENVRAA